MERQAIGAWPSYPMFRPLLKSDCRRFPSLSGAGFSPPRVRPATSSTSSMPRRWRRWLIPRSVRGWRNSASRFSRVRSKPRRHLALLSRLIPRSGGLSSRISASRRSDTRDLMKLPHRRQFLHLAAAAAVLPVVSHIARAQTYPTRAIRFILPFPAGGPLDVLARLYGQKVSQSWNKPVVVETRAGATGTIGTEVVVRAPPDGYTLLFTVDLPITMAPALLKLRYDA